MKLRPYQKAASDAVMQEWFDDKTTLVVCPTGTGKTVIATDLISRVQQRKGIPPMKTMFIAHRGELIWQAKRTMERAELSCQIEKADLEVNDSLFSDYEVVLAMVQTLNSKRGDRKRMGKFDPMQFGFLIVDEAHHGVAEMYKNVIGYFRHNPDLRVLGLTATPDRLDEEALGQMFDTVAYDYEILDAIKDGWLVPIEQQMVYIKDLDFSHIRSQGGDLNGAELAALMESEEMPQRVAGATIPIIGSKRTLVFCASVKQAEMMSEIFNRHREGSSAWVCGSTEETKRKLLLEQFSDGGIQIMCNCNCLSEGFDNPGVEVVVQARPTESRALYSQQIGRATRPLPGLVDGFDTDSERRQMIALSHKPACLVVDFVGNSGKHKLMTTADILGGNVSDEVLDRAKKRAEKLGKDGKSARMVDVIEDERKRVAAEAEDRRMREAARRAKLVANVKFTTRRVNPFDAFDLQPIRERGWHVGKSYSEKQRQLLMKIGADPDQTPYVQGNQLIVEQIRRWKLNLCTARQAEVLKRYGYETKDMTMAKAKETLDALAKNNWRKPEGVLTT